MSSREVSIKNEGQVLAAWLSQNTNTHQVNAKYDTKHSDDIDPLFPTTPSARLNALRPVSPDSLSLAKCYHDPSPLTSDHRAYPGFNPLGNQQSKPSLAEQTPPPLNPSQASHRLSEDVLESLSSVMKTKKMAAG